MLNSSPDDPLRVHLDNEFSGLIVIWWYFFISGPLKWTYLFFISLWQTKFSDVIHHTHSECNVYLSQPCKCMLLIQIQDTRTMFTLTLTLNLATHTLLKQRLMKKREKISLTFSFDVLVNSKCWLCNQNFLFFFFVKGFFHFSKGHWPRSSAREKERKTRKLSLDC